MGCFCWFMALLLLFGGAYAMYVIATKGGAAALKADRQQHLDILNEARRKAGKPPMTLAELDARDGKGPGDGIPTATLASPPPAGTVSRSERLVGEPAVRPTPRTSDPIPLDDDEDEPLPPVARAAPVAATPPAASAAGTPATGTPGAKRPSVVLLETAVRDIDQPKLLACVEKAWDVFIPANDPGSSDFVFSASTAGPAMIACGGLNFMLLRHPTTYFDDAEALAADVKELRTQKAILECRAYRQIEYVGAKEGGEDSVEPGHVYALMARLAAELAGPDTLAFLFPDHHRLYPYTDETLKAMSSPDPLTALKGAYIPWVRWVSDASGEFAAAARTARERFGEFAAAFEARGRTDPPYLIKAVFHAPDDAAKTEHMWVEVTSLDLPRILGLLRSDPVTLTHLTEGEAVHVPLENLTDWIAFPHGRPTGNFTGPLVAPPPEG